MIHHLFLYGADAASILVALVALWRPVSRRSSWMWWAAGLLGLVFIGRTIYFFQTLEGWGIDFSFAWWAGEYALQGKDPYTIKGMLPPNDDLVAIPYAPFALPIFKPFALAPLATAQMIATAMNVLICLSLGLVARRVLVVQEGQPSATLSPALAALLTAPVILSQSTHFGLETGQFSFLVTFALLAALAAQTHQPVRGLVTAACLALSTIKFLTTIPFLLLFLRRRDLRTWLFLGGMEAALLLVAGNPADLPRKFSAFFDLHAAFREPGRPGDNSMLNHLTNTMVGFEHVFYRIGLVHRPTVTALALLCMVGLGGWLAYVILKQKLPRGACCSLVSLYSMLLVYHRLYDLPILILPLFYSASRLHTGSRMTRWCHTWVVAAVLLALNAPYGEFLRIHYMDPLPVVLRVLVLPSVTYLIFSALVALAAAASLQARSSSMHRTLTQRQKMPRPTPVLAQ